jgi:hypothetical protein
MSARWSPTRITPVARTDPSRDTNGTQPPLRKERSSQMIKGTAEVEYVRLTLKLLHMVEFYMLIEFIEVVVAAIYGTLHRYFVGRDLLTEIHLRFFATHTAIYLTAIYCLPNRAYYSSVKSLTHDQLVETVGQVLQYAALELLSLGMLCVVLDRSLGLSTLRLLAFTLRKHAVLVQSQLTLWVFASTLLSLEHFGTLSISALACVFIFARLTV